MKRAIFLALTLVFAVAAASPRKLYERAAQDQTRELIVYRGFQTALILRGTLLTPTFRATLAEERRRLIDAEPDDHADFVARMERDAAAWHEVVFSASSTLPEGRRFGENDAGWKLVLHADGSRQPLVEVHRVRRPNPLHHQLYTHLNMWSDLWIARFERTVASPSQVVLKVGSGWGNGELVWEGPDAR